MRRCLAAVVTGLLVVGVSSCRRGGEAESSRSFARPVYEKDTEADVPGPNEPLGGPGDPSEDASAVAAGYRTPTLTESLDNISAANFVRYVNSLTYDRALGNGQFAYYPCMLDPGSIRCPKPATLSAYIQPEVGMSKWPYSEIDTVRFGLIVARIVVYGRGNGHIPNVNVPAGRHAWWLVRKLGGTLQSQLIARRPGGGPGHLLDTLATLPFVDCSTVTGHLDVPADSPTWARWWNCKTYAGRKERGKGAGEKDRAASALSYFQLAALAPFAPAPAPLPQDDVALDAAGWIRCGAGCCATAAQ